MELDAATALSWMERLVALAIALQTLELLAVRDAFTERGVYRWSILRREFTAAPALVRRALDALLGERGFVALLLVRLALACALPFDALRLALPLLTAATILIALRFRGSYNGGSDAMTLVVLLSLTLARLGGSASYELAGLAYAAVQLTLSYFIAGAVKLVHPPFLRGEVLTLVLRRAPYARARPVRLPRALAMAASLFVLAFECCFPLAWLGPRWCTALLALGLAFHLANAVLLGLNRFLWAWLAAYPALLYFSGRLAAP